MNNYLENLIEEIFIDFKPKQRKVLVRRFGLEDGEKATLQEIGNELGITRERVRQIESQALKMSGEKIKESAGKFIDASVEYLRKLGGVRRDDCFLEDVKNIFFEKEGEVRQISAKIKFLFLATGVPFYEKENENYFPFWYFDEKSKLELEKFVKKAFDFFKKSKKEDILSGNSHLSLCSDFKTCHFLSISKKFANNVFGDVGLSYWPEINPKTVRDKSYLILKKLNKPLHFKEISEEIDKRGINKKSTYFQTVHNELIKDERFVLVGRGMYALKEQGFEPGTVRDVIARIVKKHGPLEPRKIVELVKKERFLKENTIILALQNKQDFKKLNDGRYRVKKA